MVRSNVAVLIESSCLMYVGKKSSVAYDSLRRRRLLAPMSLTPRLPRNYCASTGHHEYALTATQSVVTTNISCQQRVILL